MAGIPHGSLPSVFYHEMRVSGVNAMCLFSAFMVRMQNSGGNLEKDNCPKIPRLFSDHLFQA